MHHILKQAKPPPAASILVIDEEESVRGLFRAILEPVGYTIVEAENGREGICRCRESPTDAVITDVHIPNEDGWEVIRALRAEFPRLKILAVPESLNPDERLTSADRLGADAVLSKSLCVDQLRTTMERLLGHPTFDETSPR